MRTTEDVFDDHLRLARDGDVETDLVRNYSPHVQVLTSWGAFEGHDDVRRLAAQLERELPEVRFDYVTRLVAGDMAFLHWTAEARGFRVKDGADSFLIRNGRVEVQTIHYTLEKAGTSAD